MRWISAALAVAVASVIGSYFSYSQECWIVLAALFTSQASRGAPLRMGMIYVIQMSFAIIAVSFLKMNVAQQGVVDCLVAITFISFCYTAYLNRPLFNKSIFTIMCFPLALLIATFMQGSDMQLMHDRIMDVLMGGALGMVFGQFILTVQPYKAFSQGVALYLQSLMSFSDRIGEHLISKNDQECMAMLPTHGAVYPEWVYEAGFNPGLRSGFRFFLLNIEKLSELLVSMSYFATECKKSAAIDALGIHMVTSMKKNNELISLLVEYFQHHRLKVLEDDFTSDMNELEAAYKRAVPVNLELLDMSPDYLALAAMLCDIKDMRELLLTLLLSLDS